MGRRLVVAEVLPLLLFLSEGTCLLSPSAIECGAQRVEQIEPDGPAGTEIGLDMIWERSIGGSWRVLDPLATDSPNYRLGADRLSHGEIALGRSCSMRTVAIASVLLKLKVSGHGEFLVHTVEGNALVSDLRHGLAGADA